MFFKPRLLLFPEGAVDTFVRVLGERTNEKSVVILNRVSRLARELNTPLLIGAHEEATKEDKPAFFNTALYFDSAGNLAGAYRKRELVPFGERDTLRWLSPSIQEMINRDSKTVMFNSGPQPKLFSVRNAEEKELKFGVLICYESTIPHYARDYVRDGADFLVNITNDLWSLTSAGMYQHAVFSVFRAIETRSPVVRASNGGYSCYVNSYGKMYTNLRIFRDGSMPLVLQTLANRRPTVYLLLGDWFAFACIGISAICLAGTGFRRKAV